jgi:hypothetical protein
MMGDIKDPRLIYFKGFLFLIAGGLAAGAILIESPNLRTAFLLGIAIWSFCRLYYFMFYVIENYVDGSYRFAGIHSFLLYLLQAKRRGALPVVSGTDSPRTHPPGHDPTDR